MSIKLHMSVDEILRSYKDVKDKNKMIGILADLNATKKQVILDLLTEHGVISDEPKEKGISKPKRAPCTKWTAELKEAINNPKSPYNTGKEPMNT